MKFLSLLFFFALGASGVKIPLQTRNCGCFNLVGDGLPTGPSTVVKDTIGENELDGSFQQGQYCFLLSNPYGIIDALGNNCIIWDSSRQFQCVSGMRTQTIFALDEQNILSADGCSNFFACPTTRTGGEGAYDLFSSSLTNVTDCFSITLRATNFLPCNANGRPPSAATETASSILTSTTTVTVSFVMQSNALSVSPSTLEAIPTTTTATPSETLTCPTDLSSGVFLPPSLIVAVSPQTPDVAYGTSYFGTITPKNTTLFAFDIPWSYPSSCALIFTFPYITESQFPYKYSGLEEEFGEGGGIVFGELEEPITSSTTYNSTPMVHFNYGRIQVIPGQNYTVGLFRCPSGQQLAISAASVGNFFLQYFQSTGGAPMGLWVAPCPW